jgi:hypothetical protein
MGRLSHLIGSYTNTRTTFLAIKIKAVENARIQGYQSRDFDYVQGGAVLHTQQTIILTTRVVIGAVCVT